MVEVSNNNIIKVTRGDSFTLHFGELNLESVNADSLLKGDDVLYFGLMEPNQPFEHALIRKVATVEDVGEDGRVAMDFSPEMTVCLLPGTYYYSVKIKRNPVGGPSRVETLINKRKFYIID